MPIYCTQELIKSAMFTLAFENSAEPDYLTEKYFLPLKLGSVPIVYSARNTWEYEPGPNSVIDAAQYINQYVGYRVKFVLLSDLVFISGAQN
jgi:hypothetical protein